MSNHVELQTDEAVTSVTGPLPFSPWWIGKVRLEHRTVLAPMEGITDKSFRAFIREMGGCGLVVTEFVSSENLTRNVRQALQMAEVVPGEHPVSIQIYGRDLARMAESAQIAEELGADVVDINMGCPSKAVTGSSCGVALMKEPRLAISLVRACRAALSPRVPLTVKMRLGWDHTSINAPELARACQEEGAAMVVVHGRTRADGYRGRADWVRIGEVKRRLSIPLVVNGDILTIQDAFDALTQSGADAVMVGRGTMRNPWLLRQIDEALRGEVVYEPTLVQRRDALLRYYEIIQSQMFSPMGALGKMKKVASFFTANIPRGDEVRSGIHHAETIEAAREAVHRYFEQLEEVQREQPHFDAFGIRHPGEIYQTFPG